MFLRLRVQIPAPYTGWNFFHIFVVGICNVCLNRPKINEKEARVGPFFFKKVGFNHTLCLAT